VTLGRYITSIEGAHRVLTADAVDDLSGFILEDWLRAGFRECVWEYGYEPYQDEDLWRQMGSVCPVCFALDGQHFKVSWLLQNMRHSAPKYTLSHVNCKCRFRRVDRQHEVLDYGEEQPMPPSAVPEEFRTQMEVMDVDLLGPEKAREMGLPEDPYHRKWVWDPKRQEFVPYTGASVRERWLRRAGGLYVREDR